MGKIGPRYSHVSDPFLRLALFLSDMKLLLVSLQPREEKNDSKMRTKKPTSFTISVHPLMGALFVIKIKI